MMGFLLIAFGAMAVSDEDVANLGAGGLTAITIDVLGETWARCWLVDVALAIIVCCLAIHAMSIRIMFAMARDNNLPCARSSRGSPAPGRVPSSRPSRRARSRSLILAFNMGQPAGVHDHHLDGHHPDVHRLPGLTTPLLHTRLDGLARQPAGRRDGLFELGGWGKLTNVRRDPLRRGHDHQPRVAARGVLRPALVPEVRRRSWSRSLSS